MTAAAEANALTPVGEDRTELLDVLRGFALLGILLVNFWGDEAATGWMRRIDTGTNEGLNLLISNSFYPLFSFMFGLGFAVQLLRARERGSGVVLVYLRRMMALLLIGAVHSVFIWNGDILLDYAIIGLLLIPVHRLRDRWLVGIALALFILGSLGQGARAQLHRLGASAADVRMTELEQGARQQLNAASNGLRQRAEAAGTGRIDSYRATLASNWSQYATTVRNRFSRNILLTDILGFFIVGLVVGRRRWLQDAATHRRRWAWIAGVGLVIAIATNIVGYTVEPSRSPWSNLNWAGQNYSLTAFYIGIIAVAFVSWPRVRNALRVFAAPGRIGLTNYLMQSIVMTLLFRKYGLAIDEPGTTLWVVVNLGFYFGVQVMFSRWWVPRFQFGPAEWLWRSMTYGTLQPMRRTASVTIPAGATGVPSVAMQERDTATSRSR
jgi:uncharacterized protein